MSLSFDPTPYALLPALGYWAAVFFGFLGICFVVALGTSIGVSLLDWFTLRRAGHRTGGPGRAAWEGALRVFREVGNGLGELAGMSPRRTWALAELTIRESLHRKALLVFVVFAVLVMFAGWFMMDVTARSDLQIKVYASFMLTAITWLVLPVVLLLACWGLPQDIKNRSLHTVVTKPARKNEILVGRMLGFAIVGTLILAVMGSVGYFWMVRNFPAPTRSITLQAGGASYAVDARIENRLHVTVRDEATGDTGRYVASNALDLRNQVGEHFPEIAADVAKVAEDLAAQEGPVLVSRLPIYGELSFTDEQGNPGRGINVGDLWEFREFISGATQASAIWDFKGISESLLGDTLVLDSHFEAFRTHKGTINRGLLVEYRLAKDLRTRAVHAFGTVEQFQPVSAAVRRGNFDAASEELAALADGISKRQVNLGPAYGRAAQGFTQFARLLGPLVADRPDDAGLAAMAQAARDAATAARAASAERLGSALEELSRQFEANQGTLEELLVDTIVELPAFEIEEFRENVTIVPRTLQHYDRETRTTRTVDLYDDLLHGDELRVIVMCRDAGQHLGMARPDLFIRMPDRPFLAGYVKALGGTWLMMVLVVLFGVTAGTFVKGPVAILLTFTLFVVGSGFHGFLEKVVAGDVDGSGTIESIVRLGKHMNPTTPLEAGRGTQIIEATDTVILQGLTLVKWIVPNFNTYRMTPYVANGFDVPWNAALLPSIMMTVAYLLPCLLIGYYSLKLRELEAK